VPDEEPSSTFACATGAAKAAIAKPSAIRLTSQFLLRLLRIFCAPFLRPLLLRTRRKGADFSSTDSRLES